MGLRDLFSGNSNKKTEKENESKMPDQVNDEKGQSTNDNEQVEKNQTVKNNSSMVTDVKTTKQQLAEIVQQYNASRAVLQNQLFDHRAEAQSAVDELNQKISAVQKRVDDNGTQITALQDAMEKAIQEATAPFVERQTELNKRIKDVQDKAGSLIGQVKDIGASLNGLNDKQQQLIQSESDLSAKFKSEKDPAVVVTLVDEYRDNIKKNKSERDANEEAIIAVDKSQRALKNQLQSVRNKLTDDQEKLRGVNGQLEEAQNKVAADGEAQSKQLDTLSEALSQYQQQLTDLQTELATKKTTLAQVNAEIDHWLGVAVPVKAVTLDQTTGIILDMDHLTDDQLAQLQQAVKLLISRGVSQIGLYTSQFTLNLSDQITKWTNALQLKADTVAVYNPLYSLQHQGKVGAKYRLPDDAVKDEWNADHTERTMTLDNGWTLKVHYYQSSDDIFTVDSYKNGQLAESSTLTQAGRLTANRFYHDDGTKNREEYYSQSGLGVLNLHYDQDELSGVELLNAVGMQVQAFDTVEAFTQWWLQNHLNQQGLLVGAIENADYRKLLTTTHSDPLALVTGVSLKQDDFSTWATALAKQQYLADNYGTEMSLIKQLNQPLTVSLLNAHNLPVSLGVPIEDN
ncbi:hypothetical protein ACFP1H_08885 [Secundilactobacillus hailunensis]|uniref:Chromosome partition protein Smc n=1 Tax=Secundilactobacillus hailunensis TaxID=2559923 RepID=A0ABW1T9D9_9LACO|nr:hypothetical protein [Secundilactobacillus hailunensis]